MNENLVVEATNTEVKLKKTNPIEVEKMNLKTADWLSPMMETSGKRGLLTISLDEYLQVLDLTGREFEKGKRGKIPSE